jgi:hypothetical protein
MFDKSDMPTTTDESKRSEYFPMNLRCDESLPWKSTSGMLKME